MRHGLAVVTVEAGAGPFGHFLERRGAEAIKELRIDGLDQGDHLADDSARFAGSVGGRAHAPEAVQHYTGKGMHHGGKGGNGKDVAGDFNGAFFSGALDFLKALGMGHRADMPDVVQNGAGIRDQDRGELTVISPSPGDGLLVGEFGFLIEEKRKGRHVSLRAIEADIALALLLGIVEGVRVEERPDEVAADVFEAKLEMSVLVNGVMAAVKRRGADIHTLFFGDLLGADQARGVTGASGGDGGIKRVGEGVAQSYTGRGGFDCTAGRRTFEHAGLRGHVGDSFYTGGGRKEVESRKLKAERKIGRN